ncbi:MAG: UTP--glucose-1-phosphate uridylyltransferase GalU [Burkholderiaceae bacterium]
MNSHRTITRAVFPVTGLGTRFLPATKASPKEMLPIVDKPLIQYAVEEAAAAGITEMIFVTGRNKRAIEDHFDKAYELEVELAAHQKYELLGILRAIKPDNVQCFYMRQPEALGLEHAILCAERLLNNQPFAVILADDLLNGSVPIMQQMIEKFKQTGNSIVGVEPILPEQTRSYGVVGGITYDDKLLKLHTIVEKPAPEDAPSNMGVIGRYILTPSIFDYLRTLLPGADKEFQLTDAIAAMLKHETVLAYQFDGKRYDCGSKLGYLEATVEFALKHPEVKDKFRHLLKEIIFDDGSELVDIPPYMRPLERLVAWTEY